MKKVYLCFALPLPKELCRLIADYVCSPIVEKQTVIRALVSTERYGHIKYKALLAKTQKIP